MADKRLSKRSGCFTYCGLKFKNQMWDGYSSSPLAAGTSLTSSAGCPSLNLPRESPWSHPNAFFPSAVRLGCSAGANDSRLEMLLHPDDHNAVTQYKPFIWTIRIFIKLTLISQILASCCSPNSRLSWASLKSAQAWVRSSSIFPTASAVSDEHMS